MRVDKFLYHNERYFIYSENVGSPYMHVILDKDGSTNDLYDKPYIVNDVIQYYCTADVHPELNDQMLVYVKHMGFAGMTPIEYLIGLGIGVTIEL
jgi:hypothetical protein